MFELGLFVLRIIDSDKIFEDKFFFGVIIVKKGIIESFKILVFYKFELEIKKEEKGVVVVKLVFEWGRLFFGGLFDEEDYGEDDDIGEDNGR